MYCIQKNVLPKERTPRAQLTGSEKTLSYEVGQTPELRGATFLVRRMGSLWSPRHGIGSLWIHEHRRFLTPLFPPPERI